MAGLELLFEGAARGVASPSDALLCLLHWELVTAGYKCRGLGEQAGESDKNSELLPQGWNDVKDVYTLRYASKDRSLLLKVIPIESEAIINLMDTKTEQVVDLTLKLTEYIDEDNLQDFERVFKNQDGLRNLVARELVEPLGGREQRPQQAKASGSQQEGSRIDPLRDYGPPKNLPHGFRPPKQPDWSDPVNPFSVGGADLDPFGRGQGGMLMDPRHRGPRPRFPGQLPLGSVPPGARFDPIGPYGTHGGPDPDHLPPPNYDDMFM
ncbi:proteasome inhibitor PI31 subunit [Lampetra fluviatilis]